MPEAERDHRNTGALVGAGLLAACLFGAATPASKALLREVSPQALAGLLYVGGALGVLPLLLREGSLRLPWRAGRRTGLLLGGAILFGGVLGPWLLLLGLGFARSGAVSLLLNLGLVATVLLGRLLFREHLSGRAWLGAAGTLVAAGLLAAGEGSTGLIATLFVAAGCLCWGFDNHFTALIDGITPAQTTFWKGAVAGLFNLALGGVLLGGTGPARATFLALGVGALAYGLSIALYIRAAPELGASRSQMVFSTAPFFGVLLSILFLGEGFGAIQAGAALLIAVSLLLLFSEQHRHAHRHEAMDHQHWHRHDDGHHDHEHEGGGRAHSHWHRHEGREHEHPHWPDLHHRHDHGDSEPAESVDEG
mgnify:CR=1 FL=1